MTAYILRRIVFVLGLFDMPTNADLIRDELKRMPYRHHTDPKQPSAGPCTPMSKGPKALSTHSEK